MSTADWALVILPVVAVAVVLTVWQMRRMNLAHRFLASTVRSAPRASSVGSRVPCGLSVRRPGRVKYSYPLCSIEVGASAVLSRGPLGGQMAEFSVQSADCQVSHQQYFSSMTITSAAGSVLVTVRSADAGLLERWSSGMPSASNDG